MFQLGDNVESVGVDLVLGDVELSGVEPRRGDGLRVQHLDYAVIFTAGDTSRSVSTVVACQFVSGRLGPRFLVFFLGMLSRCRLSHRLLRLMPSFSASSVSVKWS